MRNKKPLLSILVLSIILFQFFSFTNFLSSPNSKDNIKTSGADDINLDELSLTVPYGTNIMEDRPYVFSGAFYDITSDERYWNEAYLETQLVADSNVYANDSLSTDNNETISCNSSSISVNTGSLYNHGDLNTSSEDHYIGTYSFRYDSVSDDPSGWTTYEPTNTDIQVIQTIDSHEKVVRLQDNDPVSQVYMYNEFTSQSSGTIEFWFYKETNNIMYLGIRDGSTLAFQPQISSTIDGDAFSLDTWHHVKINFECSTGLYDGLSADTYNTYLDGTLTTSSPISFSTGVDSVDEFRLNTQGAQSSIDYHYVDAIGYSWDSNYNIDANYQYDYLIVNSSNEAGHYNATYSFENDLYSTGTDIDGIMDIGSDYTVEVVSDVLGHRNILNVSRSGDFFDFPITTLSNELNHGSIEFWFNAVIDDCVFSLFDTSLDNSHRGAIILYDYSNNEIDIYYSSTTISISVVGWVHVRIDFDCFNDNQTIYINNNLVIENVNFYNDLDLDHINIIAYGCADDEYGYYDAIGIYDDLKMYNGTYSFSDGIIDNWYSLNYSSSGAYAELMTNSSERHNVFRLVDDSSTNIYGFRKNFYENPLFAYYGTVEFWLLSENQYSHYVQFYSDSGQEFYIQWYSNDLKVIDGSGTTFLIPAGTYQSNEWHHYRIDFESTSGAYLGLSENEANFYLDGVLKYSSNDWYNNGSINRMYTSSHSSHLTKTQIDALSFSWYENSSIGDNLYYEMNEMEFEYILGDNWHFNSYNGTHNFEDAPTLELDEYNIQGILGTNWNISNDDSCTILISGEDTSHKKFLNISDNSATGQAIIYDGFNSQTSGIIESWVKISDASKSINFIGREGTSHMMTIGIDLDKFRYYDGGWFNITGGAVLDDVWYHVRIDFDCSTDTFDFYLNGSLLDSDLPFDNTATYLDSFYIITSTTDIFECHIDAIGYSWDSGYDVGDNKITDLYFEVDFTLYVEGFEEMDSLLELLTRVNYYTPILTQVNWSIYDHENSEWILINSISNNSDFFESTYIYHLVYNLIDQTNNNKVFLRFQAINMTNEFDIYLDCLNITIYRKLVLSHTKTFNLLGLWKYRFHLPEDSYSTSWYYFDVVRHEDNFMGVSESEYITKWMLLNNETEISTSRRFKEDFSGNYEWEVYDVNDLVHSSQFVIYSNVTDDSYVYSSAPDANYGDYNQTNVNYNPSIPLWWDSYFAFPSLGYKEGYINSVFNYYVYDDNLADNLEYFRVYNCDVFNESTITWNNQPTVHSTITNWHAYNEPSWNSISFSDYNASDGIGIKLKSPDDRQPNAKIYSKEFNNSDYQAYIYSNIERFLDEQNGFIFTQSNITEVLKMKSEQFNGVSLSANDYFTIDCEGSIENLDFELLYQGSVVDSLNLFVNNSITDNQTIEISVDSDVAFDQIQFSGTYNELDYFYCHKIEATGYDQETIESTTILYLMKESKSIYIQNGTYLLKIYDDNILRVEKYINITHDIEDNLEIYTPTYSIDCKLTITNQEGEYISQNIFEVYITRTLSNTTSRIALQEDTFKANLNTNITFEFYDRFGDHIKNKTESVDYFIFIEITINQLKIKNDASDISRVLLEKDGSSESILDLLAPDELMEYNFITGNYSIEWINYENNENTTYNINLTEDYVLTLPTSYFDTYFAIYNFDGLGLSQDLVKFYVNNERRDFGFNTMTQNTNNLRVLDYFNSTLYDQDVDLSGVNEYNILVEVYTLIINNNYSESVKLEIEFNSIEIKQVIPSQSGLSFRFLPNVEYDISIYDMNETLLETKNVTLDSNWKTVSFGFYSVDVYPDPLPILNSFQILIFFGFFVLGIFAIVIVLYVYWKREKSRVPEQLKPYLKKRKEGKNKNTLDYSDIYK